MSDTPLDIHYVARLARLNLTSEEEELLQRQLGQVLRFVDQLETLDTEAIAPMAHPIPQVNVTRPDEVQPGLDQEAALANAPARANGLFLVPRIVE